jgi:UDP-N-acetylmuramoyl-tripeptide--D-alanyl-D-alanine ligase
MISHILSGVAPVKAQIYDNNLGSYIRMLTATTADFDYVVCEVATNAPGCIKPIVDLLKPSIGIVTLVGLEHYSKFRTYDAVAQEKAALIEALPQHGLAILNYDDARVASMASRTKARVVTFGESGGDYVISDVQSHIPGELSLSISHGSDRFDIITCLTGPYQSLAVAAAFCCAHQLGVPPSLIQKGIANFRSQPGRCSFHRVEDGPVFILDTHKGPYYSFYLPINMMAQFSAPRKRIVVGQISDAGNTNPKYRDVYRASRLVADQVIFVGDNAHRSKATAEEISVGRFVQKRSVKEAANFIKETAIPGEIILVKSAQNLHLERLFLSFPHAVRCWEQECGKKCPCVSCGKYRLPFEEHKKIKRGSRKRTSTYVAPISGGWLGSYNLSRFGGPFRSIIPLNVRVLFYGSVQNVGFQNWLAKQANESGVVGWVRYRSDGSVEAVFEGKYSAVDKLLACRANPRISQIIVQSRRARCKRRAFWRRKSVKVGEELR